MSCICRAFRVNDEEKHLSLMVSKLEKAESEIMELQARVSDAVNQKQHAVDEFNVRVIPVFLSNYNM